MKNKSVLNFGHRGFNRDYPENTMLSFEKALEVGAHGLEFDVHLSKDGVPVIIHDESLDRTSDTRGLVRDFTFSQLQKVNVATNFSLNEKIPSLEEFFDFAKKRDIISNIELKNGVFEYRGIEQKVYDLIKKYKLQEKCIVSSFNHESILRMQDIAPELKYGFLSDSWDVDPASYLKKHNIPCYHASAYRLTEEFVSSLHAENIQVNTWFGSIPLDYKTVLETGVDIVISDEPDKIAELLANS